MAMRKPSSHEYGSLRNWVDIFQPVVEDEQAFVLRREDLVTLRPGREHAWLDSMIEKAVRQCNFTVRIIRLDLLQLLHANTLDQWLFRSKVRASKTILLPSFSATTYDHKYTPYAQILPNQP